MRPLRPMRPARSPRPARPPRSRSLLAAACSALSLAALPAAAHAQRPAPPPAPGDGVMTMALTGDAIITRRLSPYTEPGYLGMIDRIRAADMAFTNLEMLLHDYEPFPMHQSGGTYMRGDPALAGELVWAGFDMVSYANNHTGDYGADGMRLTKRHAEAAGLVGAGAGEDLFEAREARFLETADGRVALIALASTFPDHSAAGEPRSGIRGRPGLNPLRYRSWRVLPPDELDALRAGLDAAGFNVSDEGGFSVFGERFEPGPERGRGTEPDPDDVAAIAAVVADAKTLADYVVVSIHAHESAGSRSVPADFVVDFAHAVIDAGADAFVGHGPHVLRGIEIYDGKPIFYSLGDFLFQNETVLRLPEENFDNYGLPKDAGVGEFNARRYSNDTRGFPTQREIWEAVVAYPTFEGGELTGLTLEPITLGFGLPRTVRGRPQPATGELADKILDDLIERSAAFGTTITKEGGMGYLRTGISGGGG